MKRCNRCDTFKPEAEFRSHYWCAACNKEYRAAYRLNNAQAIEAQRKAYRAANKDKLAERYAEWYSANRGAQLLRMKKYRSDNAEFFRKYKQAWYQANKEKIIQQKLEDMRANPAKYRAREKERLAAKLKATPAWAKKFFIEEAYDLAALRTKMFGFEWHVDHIVPLKSSKVCGLHVECNLQVIPGAENIRKGNRHWPDMPG